MYLCVCSRDAFLYRYGETALHLAAEPGHVNVVKLLLHAGADVTIRQGHGRTALDYATETTAFMYLHAPTSRINNREEVVFVLRGKGSRGRLSYRRCLGGQTLGPYSAAETGRTGHQGGGVPQSIHLYPRALRRGWRAATGTRGASPGRHSFVCLDRSRGRA